jgi:hypothetical protein
MPEDEIFRVFRGSLEVNDYASEAYAMYKPSQYDASDVVYFRSRIGSDDYVEGFDYLEPWRAIVPRRLDVVPCGFSHAYLVSPAALQAIGDRLRQAIDCTSHITVPEAI